MYVNFEECIVRYPILNKYMETEAEVNSDMIYYAGVELNGKLATRFSVPFSDSHPTIKDLTIDFVYLKVLRSKDPDKAEKFNKYLSKRIEKIIEGKEYIFTDSNTVLYPSTGVFEIWSNTKDYHPIHSILDPESEYTHPDSDMLYEQENVRS